MVYCSFFGPIPRSFRSIIIVKPIPSLTDAAAKLFEIMADAALYALVWDEARVKDALTEASKEVKFLWGQFKVSLQAQARLAEAGFTDVEIFAAMEDSEAKVRAFILGGMGFKPDTEFVAKGTTARIISAWKAAQQRGEKRAAADA